MAGAQPTTEDQNYMISQKELLNSKNILKYQQPVLRIQVWDAYGTLWKSVSATIILSKPIVQTYQWQAIYSKSE